ncbi:MAG: alpha-L-fucosidase [Cellulosilyticaceae bacterium]
MSEMFTKFYPVTDDVSITELAASVRPSTKQLSWQSMEMYGFIHFGMNTFTDAEWGDGTTDPTMFNPSVLDALQWAEVAKASGLGQLILTAKHHDGFCLWPSQYTEYSVKNSPWQNGKGDVVKELADACRQVGLKFGVYLSPWDRHEPTYGDSPAYNQYFLNQLHELLTQYGEIAEVWFDGACGEGPNGKQQEYDFEAYYALIRKLQPEAVIAIMGPDVRWVGTEEGFGRLTEWSVLPIEAMDKRIIASHSQQTIDDGLLEADFDLENQDLGNRSVLAQSSGLVWYPSEVDVSIRPGWFYHTSQDQAVKSSEELFEIYLKSVGRNSTLLLNIPPDTRGLIHEQDVLSLKGFKARLTDAFSNNLATTALDYQMPKVGYLSLLPQIPFHFGFESPITVNCLSLSELIAEGQVVENFTLHALVDGHWVNVTSGTTIGYKRILTFPDVTSTEFKLTITQSRREAYINHVGLHAISHY